MYVNVRRWVPLTGAALALVALAPLAPPSSATTSSQSPAAASLTTSVSSRTVNTYRLQAPLPDKPVGITDRSGVRMVPKDGVLTNHPVAQAQYGLLSIESYRMTGVTSYLNRAIAQGDRLLATKVLSRDAWFFPYPFNFDLYKRTGMTMRAPWYSAMAQGQAISLFIRLHRATDDPRWLEAAQRAFAALLLPRSTRWPWVSWTDSDGRFWLEEYPNSAVSVGERVLNGQMYAMFGLYDYWVATRDAAALRLFSSALTTIKQRIPVVFRWSGWISRYSANHATIVNAKYHQVHIRQLLILNAITGDAALARFADLLRADYPYPATPGTVRILPGTYTCWASSGYSDGTRRSVKITRVTAAPASEILRRRGAAVRIHVTGGWLRGCWLDQTPARVYLTRENLSHAYAPGTRLRFRAGAVVGIVIRADDSIGSKTVRVAAGTTASVSRSALVRGQYMAQVTSGPLIGRWVPLAAGVII